MRPSERAPDALRAVTLETAVNRYAEGSCLVCFGHTRVLVTASLEEGVPPFLRGRGQGWVTAEYGMLPRATHTRGRREAAQGKQSGRTQEIQRLVGPLDARGGRSQGLGRAPDHPRLRCRPGRRRHPHRRDHRRLGGPEAGHPPPAGGGRDRARPDPRSRGGDLLRPLRGRAGARPRLRGGQQRRGRRQFRAHRAPATSSRSRPPARSAAFPATSSRPCSAWRATASPDWSTLQQAAVGG